eukprot:912763_1
MSLYSARDWHFYSAVYHEMVYQLDFFVRGMLEMYTYRFVSQADEFTQWLEHSTGEIDSTHYGYTLREMEDCQWELETKYLGFIRDADKMLADMQKISDKCEGLDPSDCHTSEILVKLRKMFGKFKEVLEVRRQKYREAFATKKEEENLCKEVADKGKAFKASLTDARASSRSGI